ncbi:Hypothetical predicted protein [Paramuricea clavata]|uniref:Uncharacterized protein n=1 Tax=Paramuricea clavata TaxID=317549 RepID=A0A6S7I0C1_PARCT|nr:Hypothetical predicted protein [Paramuricea clavata]
MSEQAIIDLPVVEGLATASPKEVAPENPNTQLGILAQDNECSTNISAIEDSGRIMFRGADMSFLKINGIQMFTFYEIMRKLCPDAKRGTVGNRFTRLKATKHACNRAEVKLVKELGGTDPSFYYCTLVARTDVERYCERYEDNGTRINRNTCSSKPDKKKSKKCTPKAKQGLKEIDSVVTDKQIKKYKATFSKGNARKKSTAKSVLPEAKSLNITKIQVDKISQELYTDEANTAITETNTQDAGKKRKRRTQFELLQSYQFYTDVTEDESHKRQKTSVSDSDDQQLEADSIIPVDINSNIIDWQNKSPKKLEEATFNYDELDLPFSDDNNNASGSVEPRSPTLLLKRSQNNKWHVAKAVLPLLNLDDTESEKSSDIVIKAKSNRNLGESKTAMTKVKNKLKALRKSSTAKKTKIDKSVRPLASIKKLGKKGSKKVKESNKNRKISVTTLDEQEKTQKFEGDPICEKDINDTKPENSDNTSASVQHKNVDRRKSLLLRKDNTDSLNKTSIVNKEKRENGTKNDSKITVKKKRRRRVEMNSFRLIETIPYSSLLVVRDGDLCPSYTMAYNQNNYLPGCCHALWRWRLGKPVKIPCQSPVKTKDDQFLVEKKQDDLSPAKPNEDYKFPPKTKQAEHSQVGKRRDEQSPVEKRPEERQIETKTDEMSSAKTKKEKQFALEEKQDDLLSPVETRPDEHAPAKEKHDDLSPIKTTQDEQAKNDVEINGNEKLSN